MFTQKKCKKKVPHNLLTLKPLSVYMTFFCVFFFNLVAAECTLNNFLADLWINIWCLMYDTCRAGRLNRIEIATVIEQTCNWCANLLWGPEGALVETHSSVQTHTETQEIHWGNSSCWINRRFSCFHWFSVTTKHNYGIMSQNNLFQTFNSSWGKFRVKTCYYML